MYIAKPSLASKHEHMPPKNDLIGYKHGMIGHQPLITGTFALKVQHMPVFKWQSDWIRNDSI